MGFIYLASWATCNILNVSKIIFFFRNNHEVDWNVQFFKKRLKKFLKA